MKNQTANGAQFPFKLFLHSSLFTCISHKNFLNSIDTVEPFWNYSNILCQNDTCCTNVKNNSEGEIPIFSIHLSGSLLFVSFLLFFFFVFFTVPIKLQNINSAINTNADEIFIIQCMLKMAGYFHSSIFPIYSWFINNVFYINGWMKKTHMLLLQRKALSRHARRLDDTSSLIWSIEYLGTFKRVWGPLGCFPGSKLSLLFLHWKISIEKYQM